MSGYGYNGYNREILGGIKPPCGNCKDRELGCHDKCIRYKEFKDARENFKEIQRKDKMKNNEHIGYLAMVKEKRRKHQLR